jgi:hypothetical protein
VKDARGGISTESDRERRRLGACRIGMGADIVSENACALGAISRLGSSTKRGYGLSWMARMTAGRTSFGD